MYKMLFKKLVIIRSFQAAVNLVRSQQYFRLLPNYNHFVLVQRMPVVVEHFCTCRNPKPFVMINE